MLAVLSVSTPSADTLQLDFELIPLKAFHLPMHAPDAGDSVRFLGICFELGQLSVSKLFSRQPSVTQAVGRHFVK